MIGPVVLLLWVIGVGAAGVVAGAHWVRTGPGRTWWGMCRTDSRSASDPPSRPAVVAVRPHGRTWRRMPMRCWSIPVRLRRV